MVFYKIVNKLKTFLGYILLLVNSRKIEKISKPFLSGLPIIIIHNKAKLKLGDKVTLHSNPFTYHLHMNSPVKLMIDRPNAKLIIGDNTRLNGCCIHAQELISIGKNCLIAANTQIFDGNGHDLSMDNPEMRLKTLGKTKPVIIEDNVWIGYNCIILPGVKIGNGSVIAAGSIVNIDVPANSIAAGNPLKIVKTYE